MNAVDFAHAACADLAFHAVEPGLKRNRAAGAKSGFVTRPGGKAAAVIVFADGFAVALTVFHVERDQFAQERGPRRHGRVIEVILDPRTPAALPCGFEEVADLVNLRGEIARARADALLPCIAHDATSLAHRSRMSRSLRSTLRSTQPSFWAISALE